MVANAQPQYLDSRASSILINLNLSINTQSIVSSYKNSKDKIEESQHANVGKTYGNLRSTLKGSYLTGCIKYGNNFIM